MEGSKQFWTKMSKFNKKQYDTGDNYYEFLATLIIIKINSDSKIAFSKFPDWFTQDNLKLINRMLMRFPNIWMYFETEEYKNCLKDKDLRKKFQYKLLNSI